MTSSSSNTTPNTMAFDGEMSFPSVEALVEYHVRTIKQALDKLIQEVELSTAAIENNIKSKEEDVEKQK